MTEEPSEAVADFDRAFPTEQACLEHVFRVRYGYRTICRSCRKPAEWRNYPPRRQYWSKCCHDALSPAAGTFLSNAQIPLRSFFYALFLTSIADGRLSSTFLMKYLGVAKRTAWSLADRIRTHMTLLGQQEWRMYEGKVYVDEMLLTKTLAPGGYAGPRMIIFGITDGQRPTFFCIPERSSATLTKIVQQHVRAGATVVCDGWAGYNGLARAGFNPSRLNHRQGLWKNERGDTGSPIEQQWTGVRRRVERVHQRVSPDFLWKYLGQFAFIAHCRKSGVSPFWRSIARFPLISPEVSSRARALIDLRK